MAQKTSEFFRSRKLTIEPNNFHNKWLLWLDSSLFKYNINFKKYMVKLFYF